MTMQPWQLGAAEAAALVHSREISSRELVLSVLARLDRVNPSINAIVGDLSESALAAADAADRAVRRGDALGPLHGVPVTLKCNVDQVGCATDRGVVAYRNNVASSDNPVVEHLRRAGAVFIGRTNAPAHMMRWFTDNELHGATLNPWNAAVTPGGSSGGAAAAVAAGIGALALGNDIAGSIRYPAYCCGVFGLRPSYGRVPSHNETAKGPYTISAQLMAVQGPIARSVADLELGFEVMAQPHVRDPYCFAPAAFPATGQPRRVALVAGGHGVHPAVAESVRAAGRLLEAAGYDVEEVEPPELEATTQLWPCLAMGDVVAQLAPVIDSTGDASSRRAMALWKTAWPFGSADMTLAALVERDRLLRKWQRFLADYPLVLMPVSNAPPFPAGADLIDEATTARINAAQGPLMAVSVLGLPAVSVPLGRHQGAPLGVQLVAGLWREDICFAAARAIEQRIPAISAIDPFMTTQETCELP